MIHEIMLQWFDIIVVISWENNKDDASVNFNAYVLYIK